MRQIALFLATGFFVVGIAVGAALAGKKSFDTSIFLAKEPRAAAAAMLEAARGQAGNGSWENLAVARVHYLSGDREAAQRIIDDVWSRKVKEEDWMRLGELYYDGGSFEAAFAAFDKAIEVDPQDAENLAKVGAFYNLRGSRERAEELFVRALEIKPDEVWVTVAIAASYAGVRPQD